ncbi:MAG: ubiquinone/menaquinone biosynthesis methyltransferase [candidate division KSB1 bacterium]|nr:ubiquinone/menaquinone biosynthesis methyltransferase [candidate division KSB1 bacterium]
MGHVASSSWPNSGEAGAPAGLFPLIARRYDLLNRIISFGQDLHWRRLAAARCMPLTQGRVLDVATGTGDQLLALARVLDPGCQLVGLDSCSTMLGRAQEKISRQYGRASIYLCRAEALNLPFRDGSFAAVTMSFAIRNFPQRLRALSEARRVLIHGGRLVILEASVPDNGFVRLLFRAYCRFIMPLCAGMLSGHFAAYRYLCDSIFHFPPPDEFRALLSKAGFTPLQEESFSLGAARLYLALTAPDQPKGFSP